ncbi:unnamed protein product [Durusdinium trenchii]|uniref:Uncharacterized protein n=1 Tax=Durusdinium trenchii TaxID=1381693 RepID=A0ABP0S2M6_9DINO
MEPPPGQPPGTPVERTWIVQHLVPLRRNSSSSSGSGQSRPSRGTRRSWEWDPPDLAGYLASHPQLEEEVILTEISGSQAPAHRLGHSVQHVHETVQATRAKWAAEAQAEAAAENEARRPSPRSSPRSPSSPHPWSPKRARKQNLLGQLLQQQVLNGSALRPEQEQLTIPGMSRRRALRLGGPLEVVQEEKSQTFSDSEALASTRLHATSDSNSGRVAASAPPRVADLPPKVKWATLLRSREAHPHPGPSPPATYLLKDRLKTGCQITSSIMAPRLEDVPDLSTLVLRSCPWSCSG